MTPGISIERIRQPFSPCLWVLVPGVVLTCGDAWASEPTSGAQIDFPPSLESYNDFGPRVQLLGRSKRTPVLQPTR
jgi:hypothetical protein